jgi:hypothetical protein
MSSAGGAGGKSPCLVGMSSAGGAGGKSPDFGPNVLIFDPSMPMETIQNQLGAVYAQQDKVEFTTCRYAYFFLPGKYGLDVQIGFYTHALGLGQSPDDVVITGAVRAKADWLPQGNMPMGNATRNFWRGAENLAVVPANGIDGNVDVWAVSQGTHLRRLHVEGDLRLDDLDGNGWASGGFIADSLVDGTIDSGMQQQFLTRNNSQTWMGAHWNMVFVGDENPPMETWPIPPYTTVAQTPVVREKPFLYVDGAGDYFVMVPTLKMNSLGHSWAASNPPGSPISIEAFYLAKPGDTAATMNAALVAGKHLMLTPGVYYLEASLEVTHPGTIVMGLGFATLIPDAGTPILSVSDVDGVTLSGLLLEAGPMSSPVLLEIGPTGSALDHSAAPTALFDVHCRVGGADVGTAARCVIVNSRDVILDNVWLWRADHGAGAEMWDVNQSINGIVVNGDHVTAYGLFVEHFQHYQTLWNGNDGAVYLYQSEMPYDPPDQASWEVSPTQPGYPSYKVASTVTSHTAAGLGVYSNFKFPPDAGVSALNAIETPTVSGVVMHHMVTDSLGLGAILHIINGTGALAGNGNKNPSYSAN